MDKEVLIQYCEMKEEIKDIRRRINDIEKKISNMGIVSDSVKGTRPNGTYGSITITGYPEPEYYKKKLLLELNQKKLALKEQELLELTCQAEEYIEGIDRSELRIMFRLYYIDGLSWVRVADRMNQMFPRRRISYSEESCKKRNQRYFNNISECPPMSP